MCGSLRRPQVAHGPRAAGRGRRRRRARRRTRTAAASRGRCRAPARPPPRGAARACPAGRARSSSIACGNAPTPGTTSAVGLLEHVEVVGHPHVGAHALERLLDAAAVAHAVVADRRSLGQRALGARHAGLGRVDRHRLAQRAGERLERRLDHVVGVRAGLDRHVQRQLAPCWRPRGRTPRSARGRSRRSTPGGSAGLERARTGAR